ncbi:MAG: hypothetical protein ABIB43_00640 [archaeon]
MKNRKAQISFEFMTVYGWAIMAILITVGALSYFGFFNMEKYLPTRCEFGQNIICEDWAVTSDGTTFDISLRLKNNLEKAIEPVGASLYFQELPVNCESYVYCPSEATVANWSDTDRNGEYDLEDTKWLVGTSCRIVFSDCDRELDTHTKQKLKAELTFRRNSDTHDYANHTIIGKVFSEVST